MRSLGYPTLLLTASLLVACSKKEETSGDAKADAKQAEGGGEAKTDDKKADDGKPVEPSAGGGEGFAATAANSAKLTATGFPASIGMIPDQAEFVLGFNMGAVMASPLYSLAAGEQNPEVQQMVGMFKDCGLDPNKFENVVVGLSQGEDLVAVVVGEGIGDDANASCVIKAIQKQAGDPEAAEVVTQDGKKVIQFTDGRAFLVDGRTLVFATTAWASAVSDLIDGKGTAAATGSKKDLFAKVDGAAAAWAVANVPAELAGMAPLLGAPAEFATVRSVTGSVDLSNGATIKVLVGFESPDTAQKLVATVQALVGEASKDAPAEVQGMLKNMKVEAAGADLQVVITATVDELMKAKDVQL